MTTGGLAVDDLHAGYGRLEVLHGASLHVAAGTITLLTGPNGAGKSTLLRAVTGSVAARRGAVHLGPIDLADLTPAQRLRHIGIVPEGRALFPHLSVEDNLRVAARTWGIGRRAIPERIAEVAARFPLVADALDRPVGTLSGGQQQLVAVARALLARPTALVLDEPSTGLSSRAWHDVLGACRDVADAGVAVLLVEQRVLGVGAVADHLAVLAQGRIVRSGPATEHAVGLLGDYFSSGGTS